MNYSIEKGEPGQLLVPEGCLFFPSMLVVGNDRRLPVAWLPWQATPSGWVMQGRCGVLRLSGWANISPTGALHCRLEILNGSSRPIEMRELAWRLELSQPDSIRLLPCPEGGPVETRRPWDFNLTHELLARRGRRDLLLRYPKHDLWIGSSDPRRFGNGFVRAEPLAASSDLLKVTWHRIEPHWDYNGLFSTRPLNGLYIHEGQTREATLSLGTSARSLRPRLPAPLHKSKTVPLCLRPLRNTLDRRPIYSRIGLFRMDVGEYSNLFAGGYDHRNRRTIEPHVCRAEYGEFLLHEYLRTGQARWWKQALLFAERFQQTSVNRGRHPERRGAVRGRYGDNQSAHRIRSMRGGAFFWDMAQLTGRDDFRATSLGIGDYLCRSFPWSNARQGAAIRDLIYFHRVTGNPSYLQTARAILSTLEEAQTDCGGWYEYWDSDFKASRYDPAGHHGGEWVPQAALKPEMASYNVCGILDALLFLDAGKDLPSASPMVKQAAEWLVSVQSPEGAWPFPTPRSSGLYGYGLYLDASAMFKAALYFENSTFYEAGMRALEFGERTLARDGMIPAVLGVPDIDRTECSLTCFYALEAFASMELCVSSPGLKK